MNAFSIIIYYLVLTTPILFGLVFTGMALRAKDKHKRIRFVIFSLAMFLGFIVLKAWSDRADREAELRYVGKYALTRFPNCEQCILELRPDKTYDVINHQTKRVVVHSDWHLVAPGDCFIVYLNGEKYQLGSGDYEYSDQLPTPTEDIERLPALQV